MNKILLKLFYKQAPFPLYYEQRTFTENFIWLTSVLSFMIAFWVYTSILFFLYQIITNETNQALLFYFSFPGLIVWIAFIWPNISEIIEDYINNLPYKTSEEK